MSQFNPGRLLASPFFPLLAGAAVFARIPPRRNSRCLLKPAPARPSPSSGRAPQGLVVPGSYRQFTDLPAVSAHFAARGWPVWLRRSGGGLVPQGPGIINL
ncbi:lipoate-protein ligase A [Klebsiella pneumoniae subsp. ozaenae]|uniref:Lipoate-protein ligase A n=1 Tax=Klebsiella pneumoniae subsp. ozaenae TaxID=574 RepID=A0A378BJY4_KLEPO|nr:lipoate-protein ligase A [Klebsiella pneumoniae subsp. ozaenae]